MQAQIKDIGYQIDALETEKRGLLKVMHKDHHSVDDVREAMKELEYKQKVTSLTAQQEKQCIRELE